MANVVASNAKEDSVVLYWLDIDADTPVVYSYECGVDSHKVVSAVRLQYDSAGNATGGTATCPVHGVALTGAAAVDVT